MYDKEGKPLWLEHPENKQDNIIDVVALEIRELKDSDFVMFWRSENFLPVEVLVMQGVPLNILGYPLGFYDTINNMPITRSGSLASVFRVHFGGQPLFLVDANLHPGTSGSPVILTTTLKQKPVSAEAPDGQFPISYLLGINSGEYGGLGLNAVWYAKVITEITAKKGF